MKLNNEDRIDWIDNDEGLYNWWRDSHLPKRKFINLYREELDSYIIAVLERKPE